MIRKLITLAVFAALLETPETSPLPDVDAIAAPRATAAALETDPRAMEALELRGFSLASLFGSRRRTNDALADTPLYASVIAVLEQDLVELGDRPMVGEDPAPNRVFRSSWLRDPRAHFELVGAVHRLDRSFVEGPGSRSACGEARLIYRLVLEPADRPPTSLPMTVNVIFPQPAGADGCRARARAWADLPLRGGARVDGLAAIYRSLPPFIKVETNLQNLHGPALRAGEDDHAEYLLRSFERIGDRLAPKPLLDTPRDDLGEADRDALATWIKEHFAEIDAGAYVIPDRFLAMRSVSVAPRGAARKRNLVFERLFGAESPWGDFYDLPYDKARLVKSPRGLLRRLDQATCSGCHETRAIAGFHLLGEDRSPEARFNALALARSNHFSGELEWRMAMIEATERGTPFAVARPFAERPSPGPGALGAHCALDNDDDPTFAGWTCAPGLRCRDLYGDEIGVCLPADGNHEGDACEDALAEPRDSPDGDRIVAMPKEDCIFHGSRAGVGACSPNHYGFPGGMCSEECTVLGRAGDGVVCADLPASGYETDCFPRKVPIETCLETHSARRRVRACDAAHPCRDDYACARVPGLAPDEGACVPPYFVFQARVDGPMLDR